MRYRHVCVESFTHLLPDEVVTSEELEARLAPVYERLYLPSGRLELMTGIRERRFFPEGTQPGSISARTVNLAIERTGLPRELYGALLHGSVCRDQLEPATACAVHHEANLPGQCVVMDVSNACLGLLNGMCLIANMIEMRQIKAGVVVGTEVGRGLVEGTIHTLLNTPDITRNDVKLAFASLTIGSGSAAVVLCHEEYSNTGNRLLGGVCQADTSSHQLCAGGVEAKAHGDDRPRMNTDSEALLHAGVALASDTWTKTKRVLEWSHEDVQKTFTHQVGKAHRKMMLEQLELPQENDFPTVEFLGNTGAVALPITAALGIEAGHLKQGDNLALLGIGSGLNSVMLGINWNQ